MNIQADTRLQIVGSAHQAVRMMCPNSIVLSDDVCAYVSGIRIGVNRIEGDFGPGDIIEYPISYLPWVDLPADLRFVSERTGREIADSFRITTYDEAIALVGMGESAIQNIVIDQGMIRGVVVNRVNGLLRPQMFARINGVVPRVINVEQPRLLEDGGASFQFSAQLTPADLGENGLTAEIFLLGQDRPLTSVSYRRADLDDLTRRMVEFEARLAQMSQSMTVRFSSINHEFTQRLDMMQQRIDAFIEYAASLIFDRIAAAEVTALPGAPPMSRDLRGKVDEFLAIVRGADRVPVAAAECDDTTVAVPLASQAFSFGWHDVEEENGVSFRWMSDIAVILNPRPDRPIAEVRITLYTPDGAAQPSLRAAFDGAPADCKLDRVRRKSNICRIRIAPPQGEGAKICRAVSLANMLTGAASARGARPRRGVVAISELAFAYAAEAAESEVPG